MTITLIWLKNEIARLFQMVLVQNNNDSFKMFERACLGFQDYCKIIIISNDSCSKDKVSLKRTIKMTRKAGQPKFKTEFWLGGSKGNFKTGSLKLLEPRSSFGCTCACALLYNIGLFCRNQIELWRKTGRIDFDNEKIQRWQKEQMVLCCIDA